MFDARLRPFIDPPLAAAARILVKWGVTANMLTLLGAAAGIAAAIMISHQLFLPALLLIILNRLLDGLDGPVARIRGASEFGGYLDILCDFLFYVSVPVAFGLADAANLLPALLLVAAFTLTAVSFLAFAAIAARMGEGDNRHGKKAFVYSTGIMEGGETILFFIIMCLLPGHFAVLAQIFAALCLLTVLQRIMMARQRF